MISPNMGQDLAEEVARVYSEAELRILARLTDMLSQGMELPDWEQRQLANLQKVRQLTVSELRSLGGTADLIQSKIDEAYRAGTASALGDLRGHLGQPTAAASPARRLAVSRVASEVTGAANSTLPNILRKVPDLYQQIVGRSVADVLTGTVSRGHATQLAINALLGEGIKVAPEGMRGQTRLADYMRMAMRTGTAKAAVEGHLDVLGENDVDLVMINPGPRHCDICDDWAGKPLWRRGGVAGYAEVEDFSTGKTIKIWVYGSLDDARAAKWGHPNCRCSVNAYLPGITQVQEREDWDGDGYSAQQKQREIEKHIRDWKTREALAITPEEKARTKAKVRQWQKAQRDHIDRNPYLKRQSSREQVGTYPRPNSDGSPRKPAPRFKGADWDEKSGSLPEMVDRIKRLDANIDPDRMPHVKDVTEKEREAVSWYAGPFYSEMNLYLREGKTPTNVHWKTHSIDEAVADVARVLERGKFEQDTRLMRTGRWSELGDIHGKKLGEDGYRPPWYGLSPEEAVEYTKQYVGKGVQHKGFVSTSVPNKTPKTTATKAAYEPNNDVVYNVLVPKGSRGSSLTGISNRASEKEVLLPPDTVFEVVDALIDPETGQMRLTVQARQ